MAVQQSSPTAHKQCGRYTCASSVTTGNQLQHQEARLQGTAGCQGSLRTTQRVWVCCVCSCLLFHEPSSLPCPLEPSLPVHGCCSGASLGMRGKMYSAEIKRTSCPSPSFSLRVSFFLRVSTDNRATSCVQCQ